MKRTSQFVLVLALSVGASLPTHGQAPELSSEVVHLLTAIEGVPARLQLQNVLPDAATTLMQLSTNEGDVAVRLRAIRSLAQYPSVASRNQLKLLLPPADVAQQGANVLVTLAILDSLGRIGDASDVPSVANLLKHPSRDVRVSVARTLRHIGAASAIDALRERQSTESVIAVKLAISEAIQALGQTLRSN
jgi:HEAT repeat protein